MATQDISAGLAGLSVIDLGRGMAPAIVTKMLAELGCDVRRFEPLSGDPFYDLYPAYRVWHRRATTRQVSETLAREVEEALAAADVCVVGGEDFPGYDGSVDVAALSDRFPDLVVLDIGGAPGDGPDMQMPAVELLAQARSGVVFLQHAARPVQVSFAPASYCAALNGLTALLAELCRKARGGRGQIARSSLLEGALLLGAQYSIQASRPVGNFNFEIPKDPHPLIFRCSDGRYIHFVLGSFGSKGSVYRILGIDDPSVKPEDSGMPNPRAGARNFFGDIDLLAKHVAQFRSDDLLPKLQAAGVAANYVMAPGECWDDPQVVHQGSIVYDDREGRHVGLTMRGRFASQTVGAPAANLAPGEPPLAGLRVLDFGLFTAGPYAGVALADLGADVIKIETAAGDPNRVVVRSYASANRGKRAFTVDLKTADGREIAGRLIDTAHVVLNNFRPGVSARLGVDPATLHQRDPDKIVLEGTGFGRSGPSGDQPGFDMIFQAFCGHEVRAGGKGGDPAWDRTVMVDYVTGLIDQVAVLVGIWRRFSGRGGADLDCSLLDAGLFLMSELVQTPDGKYVGAPPLNAAKTGFHAAEALYECADGWIAIAARDEAMAQALSSLLGFDAPSRAQWSDREQSAIAAALKDLTLADALSRLERVGVWAAACSPSGAATLEDLAASDPAIVLVTQNPVYGEVRQAGALFRIGGGRHTAPRGAPGPGEHSRELLKELGYAQADIDKYFDCKVVA